MYTGSGFTLAAADLRRRSLRHCRRQADAAELLSDGLARPLLVHLLLLAALAVQVALRLRRHATRVER